MRRVPILMYHQVTPEPARAFARYTVTPKAFAAQMHWLALARYRAISLDELLEYRADLKQLPARSVVITFDDGFHEAIEHAVPILRRHGFTATFFLVAGLVGGSAKWLRDEIGLELPLADWRTVRDLEAAGFHCGAHTVTHPRLTSLSEAACREELTASRRMLEDRLGREIRHLAYPFGDFNTRVRDLAAEAGYRSGCSTRRGLSTFADDVLALRRVSVYGHDSLLTFVGRLTTGEAPADWLRQRLGLAGAVKA